VSREAVLEKGDRFVGLYWVESVGWLEGGGVQFLVAGTGFLNQYGLAWSPDGAPESDSEVSYQHLQGPWYLWEWRL
jgi:hypothetical protein